MCFKNSEIFVVDLVLAKVLFSDMVRKSPKFLIFKWIISDGSSHISSPPAEDCKMTSFLLILGSSLETLLTYLVVGFLSMLNISENHFCTLDDFGQFTIFDYLM